MPKRTLEERREASRLSHARTRQNAVQQQQERQRNTSARAERRKDEDLRRRERQADTIRRQRVRADPRRREIERVQDSVLHQVTRSDPNLRHIEQISNTISHQRSRADIQPRRIEQTRNTIGHQLARQNSLRRQSEQAQNTNRRRIMRADSDVRVTERQNENNRRAEIRSNLRFETQLQTFLNLIKEGPTRLCTCCAGLFFPKSVRMFPLADLQEKYSSSFLDTINNHPSETAWICWTCFKSASNGNVPKLCESNGFYYPPIPIELQDLKPLEERLCAARIPFMQIRSLSIDRQLGLKGNVVNVWNPVNQTINVLPQKFSDSSTVQLAFMRKMEYDHPYMFETIRPAKVYKAAKYLTNTELYNEEGILLSEEWANRMEDEEESFITSADDIPEEIEPICASFSAISNQQMQTNGVPNCASESESEGDSEGESEDERDEPENPGSEETMIHQRDLFEGIRYAPGQGQTPISLLRDQKAEILSFPAIFCGQPRPILPNIKVSYTDIVKSEARRKDRRGCTPLHLLYQYKLLQIQKIHNAVSISLRKKKVGKATAAELRNAECLNEMINHDDGYRVLKGITSSPAHWEDEKKKLMAMIRQFGLPTFFLTQSAAEQHWDELIKILEKVVNDRELTDEEVSSVSWTERSSLIRQEPLTCAQYFDHKFRSFNSTLLKTGVIFEEYTVDDSYERTEFQHRGSPHKHILLWLKDSPKFDEKDPSTFQAVCDFIDRFITTENHPVHARYQSHRHSFSCRRNTKSGIVCRFGIPVPPMPRTMILFPNKNERTPQQRKDDQKNLQNVKEKLKVIRRRKTMNVDFDNFLQDLNLTEQDYLHAVRSSVKHPTVFLKRNADAAYINAYNTKIAKAWKANIDLQFILDPWACAKYIVQYVNKSAGGISKLLRKAAEDVKRGNLKLRDKLWRLGNCFVNGVEVSAQEAAWGILGFEMSRNSRACTFIPTSTPEERVSMVKSQKELEGLDESSTNVTVPGTLDHYIHRPQELELESLASFCAWYEFSKRKTVTRRTLDQEDNAEAQLNAENLRVYQLNDRSGFVRRRTKAKIIRYRKYAKHLDEANYYREQCMLYLPWRNEETDILNKDFKSLFTENLETILRNRKEFDPNFCLDMENIQEAVEDEEQEQDNTNGDAQIDEQYRSYFSEDTDVNVFGESASSVNRPSERFSISPLVSDNEYLELVRSLNPEQRPFFNHILSIVRDGQKQNRMCLGGGAGTGKTRVIKAIVQAIYRHELSKPGHDPSLPSVLLCAPTGKAAFGIGGTTIHTAFSLPLSQCTTLCPLDPSTRNTLYAQLIQVVLIIMDEVSMCSARNLSWIDCRLREIFQSDLPFAGINILVVGDFHQLRPVGGSPAFCSTSDPLGKICGPVLWRLFKFYELQQIMRQREDVEFAVSLNNLAIGALTEHQTTLFKEREICNNLEPPEKALRLFGTNAEVDEYNAKVLNTFNTEGAIAVAKDVVHGVGSNQTKAALLESVKNLSPKKTQNLFKEVILKIGARYMITVNVDVSDGLSNGTTGVLKKIFYGQTSNSSNIPIKLFLLLDEEDAGKKARSCADSGTLTPISVVRKEIYSWPAKKLAVTRVQFPVTPAEGMTYWKAQGMTCKDGVVVKLKKGIRRPELYVACSRSPSFDLLFFEGNFQPPNKPAVNDIVEQELQRLKSESLLMLSPSEITNTAEYLNICYHNVQSLPAHINDIRPNTILTNCDILLFVETWSLAQDNLDIPDFTIRSRLNCPDRRRPYGYIVYAKEGTTLAQTQQWSVNVRGAHAELVLLNAGSFDILLGYNSPKMTVNSFLQLVREPLLLNQDRRILVVGDFNLDLNNSVSNTFKILAQQHGLVSLMPEKCSTTLSGTQIDVCYTNDRNSECQTSETTYSHHKPILIKIPK